MARFFTADTHFTLKDFDGTILRDGRPFKSCKQMNEFIIKQWNKQAEKDDVIYHLGDFINFNHKDADDYEKNFSLVKKLKSKVVLILGNNEERLLKMVFDDDFEKFKSYLLSLGFYDVIKKDLILTIGGDVKVPLNILPYNVIKNYVDPHSDLTDKYITVPETKVYLTHEPINHRDDMFNLFGHVHSLVKAKKYGFNVGVDVNHFKLMSEYYILYLLSCSPVYDANVYN